MPSSTPQPAKAVLALRRISNRALAERVGVTDLWIGRVLNGRYRPSRELAERIAVVLDEPVEELFRPEDLEPRPPAPDHPGDLALRGEAS